MATGYTSVGGPIDVASAFDQETELGQEMAETQATFDDSQDYAGDVVFVRDDPEEDRWDGQEWLTSQRWFDVVWEGHENDSADLPGPATWGTEDSFVNDPAGGLAQLVGESLAAIGDRTPWWVPYAVAAAVGSVLVMAFSYTVGQLVTVTHSTGG